MDDKVAIVIVERDIGFPVYGVFPGKGLLNL
jgi:hypothetical protein